MSLLKLEPFAAVESMDELLAIAYAMERKAIDGYSVLAERMRREGRPDLVPVFEQLAVEESEHLANVVGWSERVSGGLPDLARLKWDSAETFDTEGADTIAPELLSAYRAFSMAVRNEERAFLFWTYVAAQTDRDSLRQAAERMAREELGHLATLRRERRQAFHAERDARPLAEAFQVPDLEARLADHLEALAARTHGASESVLHAAAQAARERSTGLARKPLGPSPLLKNGVAPEVTGRIVPLCELLLDSYLDYAERPPGEKERKRAQQYAGSAIECRSLLRELKR
jgi:rubrerythrin